MAEEKDNTVEESVGADQSNDPSTSEVQTADGGEQASTSGGTENPTDVFEVWSRILLPAPGEPRSPDLEMPANGSSEMAHANKRFERFPNPEDQRADMKISLGLFPRRKSKEPDDKPTGGTPPGPPDGERPDGRPDGKSPPLSNTADRLRVNVAIEFLGIVGAPEDYTWRQICEMVVPDEEVQAMERRYFIQPNQYQDGEIQCLLTLDSIFLACFLMVFLGVYPWMVEKVEDLISNQARDAFHSLSYQLLKPENQVPLYLIKNVYKLLVTNELQTQERDVESMDEMCREVTDFVVGRICSKFVESNGLPSFHTPLFLGTKVVRQINVLIKSEDVLRPRPKTYASAIECRNLLHCQAEALWGSSFPAKYLIDTGSQDDSKAQNLLKSTSRPAIMHNSYPSDVKGAPQGRGMAAKIQAKPEEVMQYEEDLKAVVDAMLMHQGLKRMSNVHPQETEHEVLVRPIVKLMREAVASGQQDAEPSSNQKKYAWIGRKIFDSVARLALKSFESNFEAQTLGTDTPDPLSSSLPTASELSKYGVSVQGQEGAIFPRFERQRFRSWRATLYLPKIKNLGKGTGNRWQSVLEYEDKWTHCTGIWDDIMWLYRFQKQRKSPKQKKKNSQGGNGGVPADQSQSNGENVDTFNPKGRRKPFLSYVLMMDELVNTEEDVETLLSGAEPVINSTNLGSQTAVLEFFNSAADKYANSKVDDVEWVQLKTQVKNFHNNKMRRWWVQFLNENLGKPWVVFSLLAGLCVSAGSSIQAYYSIKDNY